MVLDLQNLPGEGKGDGRGNWLEGRMFGHPNGLEGVCGVGASRQLGSTSSKAGWGRLGEGRLLCTRLLGGGGSKARLTYFHITVPWKGIKRITKSRKKYVGMLGNAILVLAT